jgi:hypothetical protein
MKTTACIAVLASLLVMASVPAAEAAPKKNTVTQSFAPGDSHGNGSGPYGKGNPMPHTAKGGDFTMHDGSHVSTFDGSATYGSHGGPMGTTSAKEGGNAAGKKK